MHFALIGLPGCGKSTIGRQLARTWGIPFVDVDQAIEQRIGSTIKDYFATHGETAFRDAEEQVLAQCLAQPLPCVLSTGGGAVLRATNRVQLRQHSHVFYLQCPPEDIARRLRADTTRPLLQGEDPLQKLKALHEARSALYLQTAHYVIDAAKQNASQVCRKVCMQAELAGLRAGAVPGQGCGSM